MLSFEVVGSNPAPGKPVYFSSLVCQWQESNFQQCAAAAALPPQPRTVSHVAYIDYGI